MPKKFPTFTDPLSIVAHDLKTPLSSVRGYIELIQSGGELNERQQVYSERALLGLDRMMTMIESLLDMSRLEQDMVLNWGECNIAQIVEHALDLVAGAAQSRDISLHLDVEAGLDLVPGDCERLVQVVHNLLSNAVKYNRDGGDVWITAVNETGVIRVSVRDTGLGIAAEDQSHVFEKFYRGRVDSATRIDGTGLGLAIVQTIIERHDGDIWLESVPDGGTTFHFTLPRREQAREGQDRAIDEIRRGEGHEVRQRYQPDVAIEHPDAVDDDLQEASGTTEGDSTSDVV
jgi:signal transduction histidine kinase